MTRRAQSRWVGTSMDTFMQPAHSGVLGNPLTEEALSAAMAQPAVVRHQPPACASKHYSVLGRADPLELGAADQAAFASLDSMLSTVNKEEIISDLSLAQLISDHQARDKTFVERVDKAVALLDPQSKLIKKS